MILKKVLSDLKKELSSVSSTKDSLALSIAFLERTFSFSGAVCYVVDPSGELSIVTASGNPVFAEVSLQQTQAGAPVGLTFEATQPLLLTLDDPVLSGQHSSKCYFLGIPLLRGRQKSGVLACYKNDTPFSSEDSDILKVIAVYLADLLYQMQTTARIESFSSDFSTRYDGYPLVNGLGYGLAHFHHRTLNSYAYFSDESADAGKKRLTDAIDNLSKFFDEKAEHLPLDERAIFSAYQMILRDKSFFSRSINFIEDGLSPETSVYLSYLFFAAQFAQISDVTIREKIIDLEDITFRLCNYLTGAKKMEIDHDVILISKVLGPAELLDYDLSHVKGILLEEASPTMHVTIIARSAGIPLLGGISDLSRKIKDKDPILLDANNRNFCVRPPRDMLSEAFSKMKATLKTSAFYQELKNLPTETQDGQKITLLINAGLVSDVDALNDGIAQGVGLYRTELPFMMSNAMPSVDEQISLYQDIYRKADGKKVIFRTLDIGSDKTIPYFGKRIEANPAMGLRSIRLSIDRKAILRQQIRAMLIAAEDRPLHIMFPMITEVSEFIEARETVFKELQFLRDQGYPKPKELNLGSMIEVPALVMQLSALLPLVDFVSVGTNDLAQFLFAYDRSNLTLAGRYDLLAPSMISVLKTIADMTHRFKKPCSICGEMAGQPLDAMVLLGLGFTSLSMNATSLPGIKMMLRSLDLSSVRGYIDSLKISAAETLRGRFMEFAVDKGITLEMTET